ncbi:hypothetical protein ABH940_005555 [Streptacidiphilus sp. BW17]|uniref:hypothetical protein n=1 Tax=Streptacidiphilus sp. BW17 TaxID=3156274 RepID=UPI003514DAD6
MSTAPALPRYLGTSMVCKALELSNLDELDSDPALLAVCRDLRKAAQRLDHAHLQLVQLAYTASQDLKHIAFGTDDAAASTHGALGSTALRIELLAARRAEMMEQLPSLIGAYRRLAEVRGAQRAAGPDRRSAALSTTARPDALHLSPAQEAAVLAIGTGEVLVMESVGARKRSVACSGPERITMPTVNFLVTNRLVHWDSSTSLLAGQRLSLTTAGEARRVTIIGKHQPPAAPGTTATPTPAGDPHHRPQRAVRAL